MDYIENFIKELPEMKSGEELVKALSVFPDYNDSIRQESQTVRLMRLSDLYRLYVPSNMSTEIYAKLYLALLRSLQKKGTQALSSKNIRITIESRIKSTGGFLAVRIRLRL